jgi:hypothetical protein
MVIAGIDPAIHPLRKKMDARVEPAHDAGEGRMIRCVSKTASRAARHPLPLKRFCRCGRPTPEARGMKEALSMDWARLCPPYRD